MSKNEELKDQELESVVGGAKTQQAASEVMESEEYGVVNSRPARKISDVAGLS